MRPKEKGGTRGVAPRLATTRRAEWGMAERLPACDQRTVTPPDRAAGRATEVVVRSYRRDDRLPPAERCGRWTAGAHGGSVRRGGWGQPLRPRSGARRHPGRHPRQDDRGAYRLREAAAA